MAESGCEGGAEPLVEGTAECEQTILDTAGQISRAQYEKAKKAVEEALTHKASKERLIEVACELMAESFRYGINLTLETYGLAEPTPTPSKAEIPVLVFGKDNR